MILEASKIALPKFLPLIEKLKKFKEGVGLKIVAATDVPGYQNFLGAGADIYIPKPYDLEILLKEVRRLKAYK